MFDVATTEIGSYFRAGTTADTLGAPVDIIATGHSSHGSLPGFIEFPDTLG